MSSVPLLPDRQRPLVFAHRGCSSLAPENTMAAFKKAREFGCPGIELDVHCCASGELVVAHDDSFGRTAGDPRYIEALSLAEIRAIDVGSRFDPEFSGETAPLLSEVLEEFLPDMYIDIEMKTGKTRGDPLPKALADLLVRFGDRAAENVSVSSFNPIALRTFKKYAPRIPSAAIWSIAAEVPFVLRRGLGRYIAGCDYCKPVYSRIHKFNVFIMKRLEKRPLIAWTVDDPVLAQDLLRLGCEGIITNRPQDMCFLAEGSVSRYG
ncbi:glycerophosphodiester phosphodiesterase [Treponema sp. OttesenSCG-928-L16]|nr:glycerophosphodiester phosphodiesterase [Treponema sp. OttesenSCG-928-L16]